MIIVTGGAGFVGSNMVKSLNERGYDDIIVVDSLGKEDKFKNLVNVKCADYQDKEVLYYQIENGKFAGKGIEACFHIGACSDTMDYNGDRMMEHNFDYSKILLHFCLERKIPFIYASSASVYGSGAKGFRENPACEEALNVYAFSKMMLDRYVRQVVLPQAGSQVVGLRYFNVYGPQENHKGRMASIVYQLYNQLCTEGFVKLFKGTDGYGDGEQRRDFIYVKDVAKVNLFFLDHPDKSGIFNCGTGQANTFNAVARALIKIAGQGRIEYVDFPETLKGKYQSFTEADTAKLLAAGYDGGFMALEDAVADYYRYLKHNNGYLL